MGAIAHAATENRSVAEFTEQAYLNYAMYVIMDRALPHIADGLKPVQRRIVYAMSELGLKSTTKPKKSARTVGDVLGKFHPHGDSACYEAMVLMAQPFSYRYPLIDGQGNWGSPDDPKSFAAMRYTEAKLSPYSDSLLSELAQGTVDWQDNFDGSLKEPVTLPARLPNILLNGTTGIAVGMATDIPPHNLREVVKGTIALLKNPELSDSRLAELIPGPDLPTRAELVTPPEDLLKIQMTGRGSYRMRAVYTVDAKKGEIIITALPFQVSGNKVLTQIAEQMQAKKLPLISDLRDESDHENPTRLVVVLRSSRVDADAVMSHLFATTELESSYRVNMNMIGLDGRPQVKSVKTVLAEWLVNRQQTVRRRLQFQLDKIEKRLHILVGLIIAYLNIDEVIHIIRNDDHPKPALMKAFGLDDIQADAILDLKLRHLAKLEEMELRREQGELEQARDTLRDQLQNPESLKKLITDELQAEARKHGNDRQSPLIVRTQAVELTELEMTPAETMTVVLSGAGWIRSARGEVDPLQLTYRTGDQYLHHVTGKSNRRVIFLDTTGRSYALPVASLPSARGFGEPVTTRLTLPAGASCTQLLMGEDTVAIMLGSRNGYGFITSIGALDTGMKAGKTVLALAENDRPLPATTLVEQDSHIAVLSSAGRLIIFDRNELPVMARGKGNKLIQLGEGEEVAAWTGLSLNRTLKLYVGTRSLSLRGDDLVHYTSRRGLRGHLLPRGFQNTRTARMEVPSVGQAI